MKIILNECKIFKKNNTFQHKINIRQIGTKKNASTFN